MLKCIWCKQCQIALKHININIALQHININNIALSDYTARLPLLYRSIFSRMLHFSSLYIFYTTNLAVSNQWQQLYSNYTVYYIILIILLIILSCNIRILQSGVDWSCNIAIPIYFTYYLIYTAKWYFALVIFNHVLLSLFLMCQIGGYNYKVQLPLMDRSKMLRKK